MSIIRYRTLADLPQDLRVFPLTGALLLPCGQLPLNIFEPRYLAMVDEAMAGDRLIGMIQPAPGAKGAKPNLSEVGCVGRVTQYAETEDGRYLISLTGVARFRVALDLPLRGPFRHVAADFTAYVGDLGEDPSLKAIDRAMLEAALKRYVIANGYKVEWSLVEQANLTQLLLSIAELCPFDPMEKQSVLEAPTLADRAITLTAILELNAAAITGGGVLQ
jgi:Lon protease-like protein